MENKINISPAELVALSSSLAICLYKKLTLADLITLRQFLGSLCSNISLIEYGDRICPHEK